VSPNMRVKDFQVLTDVVSDHAALYVEFEWFLLNLSLKYWQESTEIENVLAEKSRIERVISEEYIKCPKDIEYNQFVLDFIKQHGREIVYTDDYNYDIDIPDEQYEINIDTIINKYRRKNLNNPKSE
jgi:hypothetical protein